jgi:hypothetical protein
MGCNASCVIRSDRFVVPIRFVAGVIYSVGLRAGDFLGLVPPLCFTVKLHVDPDSHLIGGEQYIVVANVSISEEFKYIGVPFWTVNVDRFLLTKYNFTNRESEFTQLFAV